MHVLLKVKDPHKPNTTRSTSLLRPLLLPFHHFSGVAPSVSLVGTLSIWSLLPRRCRLFSAEYRLKLKPEFRFFMAALPLMVHSVRVPFLLGLHCPTHLRSSQTFVESSITPWHGTCTSLLLSVQEGSLIVASCCVDTQEGITGRSIHLQQRPSFSTVTALQTCTHLQRWG